MPDDTDLAPEDGPGLLDTDDATYTEGQHADLSDAQVDDPDETPGETLDTGEDIGKTLPVDEGDSEIPLDAPAAAVLDPGPPPITPASSTEQYEARVRYENLVNNELARWWEVNQGAVAETLLAGGTVELNHSLPESEPKDDVALEDEAITPKS